MASSAVVAQLVRRLTSVCGLFGIEMACGCGLVSVAPWSNSVSWPDVMYFGQFG